MTKVVGVLLLLVAGLMLPVVLVAGAIGALASGSPSGSSSPLIAQLEAAGYENGRLPEGLLTDVSDRADHRCLVAQVGGADFAWMLLVAAADSEGVTVEGGWCYRTYEAQEDAWNRRRCYIPGNCDGDPYPPTARPGTSVHGWGLAIDIWGAAGLLACSSPELLWLQINAPRYGWVNPEWARCGRSGAEPWHWEYVGTDLVLGAQVDDESE